MTSDVRQTTDALWGVSTTDMDWETVYAEQLPRVYNYFRYRVGNEAVAEDLTSRTFEKAWRERHRYRHDVAGVATTPEELRTLHALKTGRLIGASVTCVLLLEGLPEAATMPYRRFAAELGVLFQIVDDILDVTGTDDDLGKPQGSDERHGKHTYVSEFGLAGARKLAGECHAAARSTLAQTGSPHPAELEQITDFILTRTA